MVDVPTQLRRWADSAPPLDADEVIERAEVRTGGDRRGWLAGAVAAALVVVLGVLAVLASVLSEPRTHDVVTTPDPAPGIRDFGALPSPRDDATVVAGGGHVYVVGGRTGERTDDMSSREAFRRGADGSPWERLPDVPFDAPFRYQAAWAAEALVVVAVGADHVTRVAILDPVARSWEVVPSASDVVHPVVQLSSGMVAVDEQVLVGGPSTWVDVRGRRWEVRSVPDEVEAEFQLGSWTAYPDGSGVLWANTWTGHLWHYRPADDLWERVPGVTSAVPTAGAPQGGDVAITSEDGEVFLWRSATTSWERLPDLGYWELCPNETLVVDAKVVVNQCNRIAIWDGEIWTDFQASRWSSWQGELVADGDRVHLWRGTLGRPDAHITPSASLQHIDLDAGGEPVGEFTSITTADGFVASRLIGEIYVRDLEPDGRWQHVVDLEVADGVGWPVLSRDRTVIYVGTGGPGPGVGRVYRLVEGRPVHFLTAGTFPALSPDAERMATYRFDPRHPNGGIAVVDAESGFLDRFVPIDLGDGQTVSGLSWADESTVVVTSWTEGSSSGVVWRVALESGDVGVIEPDRGEVTWTQPYWTEDGVMVLERYENGSVGLVRLDAAAGQVLDREAMPPEIETISVRPDGRVLALGGHPEGLGGMGVGVGEWVPGAWRVQPFGNYSVAW